jgi:hypothetical protein
MSPTRWTFEYAGIILKKEMEWRTATKTAKDMFIHFFGLDAVPPVEDKETGELQPPPVEYMPLTAFLNPEMYMNTMNKRFELSNQERIRSGEDIKSDSLEYDAQVAQFDDLVPMFDEIFEEAEEKIYMERLEAAKKAGVIQVVDDSQIPRAPEAPSPQQQNTPKARRVKLEGEEGV